MIVEIYKLFFHALLLRKFDKRLQLISATENMYIKPKLRLIGLKSAF